MIPTRRATGPTTGPRLAAVLALALGAVLPLQAQQRRYLIELGAAGVYQSFADATNLQGAAGGLGRIGLWLPANFSVEGEISFTKPKPEEAVDPDGESQSVRTITGSVLYNARIGTASFVYLKGSVGSTNFGDCPPPTEPLGPGPCGSSGIVGGGLGLRVGITPTVMVRGEGVVDRSTAGGSDGFTNMRASLGLSVMLGSRPIVDSDGDGVLDQHDRCGGTPAGALVDARGCPRDSDGDEVLDGIDRCPDTPKGIPVGDTGCPLDTDDDGVPDGMDRCENTPRGVAVDETGCQRDYDKDGVPDGLDRCAETPQGATVDALGCPGDEDEDGVLDGLDRCPRTPPGVPVDDAGCPRTGAGQAPAGRDTARAAQAPPEEAPEAAEAEADTATTIPAPTGPVVLRGVTFASGSARLEPGAAAVLDSVARMMLANPELRWEIAGHTDDTGTPAANLHLSTLRAEAVRSYLISKGVPFRLLTARGYGSTQPLERGTTPAARAANRRVELRPRPSGN